MEDPRFQLPDPSLEPHYKAVVSAPFAALRRQPSRAQPIDTELLYGQGFDVYSEQGPWAFGRLSSLIEGKKSRPLYIGYLPRRALSQDVFNPSHKISVVSAPVFSRADIKAPLKTALPMNAKVMSEKTTGDFIHVVRLGYIHKEHVLELGENRGEDFVDVAGRFIGQPYIWGGTGGVGVDCSGLLQMSLAACEADAPRDADMQEKHLGKLADLEALQRGDLIFWPGHVGIMETETRLLHANAYHMCTAREPLKKAIQRIGPPRSVKRLG